MFNSSDDIEVSPLLLLLNQFLRPLPINPRLYRFEQFIMGVPKPNLTNSLVLPLLSYVYHSGIGTGGIRIKIYLLRLTLFIL